MRISTVILIFVSFFLLVIFSFPLRGVIVFLDEKKLISAKSIDGFWWKGQLEQVQLEERPLGNIKINYLPLSLFKGKFAFNLDIESPQVNFEGIIGLTVFRNIFLENINLSANPKLRVKSVKPLFQEVSNIKAKVSYLYFNDDKCVRAKGTGTGEVVDVFGLFSQNLKIDLTLTCREDLFELAFKSTPDSILEGEVLVKTNLEYDLEVRSKRLSSKIREASKLNFTKDPSFKASGRLDELMNIY
tara:strand:+ start:2464 stop:3195 length:732 start_codon:yes stop_codon:yes gene_type:complete